MIVFVNLKPFMLILNKICVAFIVFVPMQLSSSDNISFPYLSGTRVAVAYQSEVCICLIFIDSPHKLLIFCLALSSLYVIYQESEVFMC